MNFTSHWLNSRFPYDSQGRNEDVVSRIIEFTSERDLITVLDLGAGSGSNYRYFHPRLKCQQLWYCLDLDPELVGYMNELEKPDLRAIHGSVFDVPDLIPVDEVDIVMANALFDLFTEEEFRKTINLFADHLPLMYFSMNYVDMMFSPSDPSDRRVIHWFGEHMQRVQEKGRAMGPDGPARMEEMLSEITGKDVMCARSDWLVPRGHREMQFYALGIMEGSIPELDLSSEEILLLADWLNLRYRQARDGVLSIRVEHRDLLV